MAGMITKAVLSALAGVYMSDCGHIWSSVRRSNTSLVCSSDQNDCVDFKHNK